MIFFKIDFWGMNWCPASLKNAELIPRRILRRKKCFYSEKLFEQKESEFIAIAIRSFQKHTFPRLFRRSFETHATYIITFRYTTGFAYMICTYISCTHLFGIRHLDYKAYSVNHWTRTVACHMPIFYFWMHDDWYMQLYSEVTTHNS